MRRIAPADPTLAERYVRWLMRHGRAVVAAAAVLVAASAYLAAFHLPLYADLSDLLPRDVPAIRDLHRLEARLSSQDAMLAVVMSDDPAERAAVARELADRAAALDPDLVAHVQADDDATRAFARAHRHLYAPLDQLEAAERALSARLATRAPRRDLGAGRARRAARAPRRRRGAARSLGVRVGGRAPAGGRHRDRVPRDRRRARSPAAGRARPHRGAAARRAPGRDDRVLRRHPADARRARRARARHADVEPRDRRARRARVARAPAVGARAGAARRQHHGGDARRVRPRRGHRRPPQRGDRVPRRDHRRQRRQLRHPARRALPRRAARRRLRGGDGARDRRHAAADAGGVARRGDRVRRARGDALHRLHGLRR